ITSRCQNGIASLVRRPRSGSSVERQRPSPSKSFLNRVPIPDLVLAKAPAQEDGLAAATCRKIHEAFVEILHLHTELDDVVDRVGQLTRMPLHLGSRFGKLRGRDSAAVATDPAFELLLTLERLDVRSPMRDHPLDERSYLRE